jgi:imidazolonepropionase-like amidohydrolase
MKSSPLQKMKMLFLVWITFLISSLGFANGQFDLVIKNAIVFNSKSATITPKQDILINDGIIVKVVLSSTTKYDAKKIINAQGKLVTPGFIDVHTHPTDVLGDDDNAPVEIKTDSIPIYKKRISETYLPYGITTIRMVGHPEKWLPFMLAWQLSQDPSSPDIFTSGGAMVTLDTSRKTYIGHVAVNSPIDAENKVLNYYKQGVRHIKLYWRLQYPEFKAAISKAIELKMNICGHIGDNGIIQVDSAIRLGLKNIEHFYTLFVDNFNSKDYIQVEENSRNRFSSTNFEMDFMDWKMEQMLYLGRNYKRFDSLKLLMKKHGVSLTPTIHIFAKQYGLTYITDSMDSLRYKEYENQKKAYLQGYQIMSEYLKQLYESGIQLNLGTDCKDGGKAALSEMILLHKVGIPSNEVLKIATYNSAKAMGIEQSCGVIEKGKKANLIIFDKNPIEKIENILKSKTIIKDGEINIIGS